MDVDEEKNMMLVQFLSVTGLDDLATASEHLQGTEWDLQAALDNFFAGGAPRVVTSVPPRGVSPPPTVSPRGDNFDDVYDDFDDPSPFLPPPTQPPPGLQGLQGLGGALGGVPGLEGMLGVQGMGMRSAGGAGGGVEDEDRDLMMAIAASMDSEVVASTMQGGGAGGGEGGTSQLPLQLPRFRPPSERPPAHLLPPGAADFGSVMGPGGVTTSHNQLMANLMGMGGMAGFGGAMDSQLMYGQSTQAVPESVDGGREGGGSGMHDSNEDDEQAFMEAAIRASLEEPQPAAADDDDPLLAEAIKASMQDAKEGGGGAAEDLSRFPALKRQQEAERARGRPVPAPLNTDGPDLHDLMGFGGFMHGRVPAPRPAPAAPSPGTLEARRVRAEQDYAYEQSVREDAKKEEERRKERLEAEEAEKRALMESRRAAEEEQERKKKIQSELERKRASLPPEPPQGSDTVQILLRLPDGSRLPPRRFRLSEKVQHVYDFLDVTTAGSEGELPSWTGRGYDLVSNMPVKVFRERASTLQDAEITGQMVLMVQQHQTASP